MKASIPRRLVRTLCLFALTLSWPLAAAALAEAAEPVIGVNIVNPQWLPEARQDQLLATLRANGVQVIRVPLLAPYDRISRFIVQANAAGIRTVLNVYPSSDSFRPDAKRRPPVPDKPWIYAARGLSGVDPERFRAFFAAYFSQMEARGVVFAGLELGNEINWTPFNGDFPYPGEGRVFGEADLERDPEARIVAAGYQVYLRLLAVMKEVRDSSRLNRATPLISAGLADPGREGARPGPDAVAVGATLRYLRRQGLDRFVDAYAVHLYPAVQVSPERRRTHLRDELMAACGTDGGKPCWITEWGLPAAGKDCPEDDSPRTPLMREMREDFRALAREGRLTGLIYYPWEDRTNGIYRCGALTEAGRLALAPLADGP
ncbi:MAG TPA: hypothetical protein VMI52_13635 [Acetobacteraceae bacterium]|nr:hypothetical protein [Acetobacteraceae bacterium]